MRLPTPWEFPLTIHWVGMDIFWNCTLSIRVVIRFSTYQTSGYSVFHTFWLATQNFRHSICYSPPGIVLDFACKFFLISQKKGTIWCWLSTGLVYILACVASVSVRLSARSMHFSLFWPPPRCFHQCCARPNFCAAKKRKTPTTGGKPYGNACYPGYIHTKTIISPQCRWRVVHIYLAAS